MLTQLNLLPTITDTSNIEIFAITNDKVKELSVVKFTRLGMGIWQAYIEIPEDAQRIEIEVDGFFFCMPVDENTKRAIRLGKYPSQSKEEREIEIAKSMAAQFAIDAYDGENNEDVD